MNVSPSSLSRVAACMGSAILPQTGNTSPAAVRGTAIHAFLAMLGRGIGRDIALAAIDEDWRESCAGLDLESLPGLNPESGVPELAIAWDLRTGEVRELARGGTKSRDEIRAMARDGELVGIFDWVGLTEAAAIVVDFKSGHSVVDRAEVNWQVGCGAVMVTKLFQRDRAEVVISRVGKEVWHDRAHLDALDLDDIESRIRALVAQLAIHEEAYRATGVVPKLEEGDHCRWCPAFSSCSAKVALAKSILSPSGETPAMFAALPVPLSAADAVSLWGQLKLAADLVEKLQKNIREMAAREPLHLKNGNVLAEVEKNTSKIIPERLKAFLADDSKFYEEVVERKETVTKDAVRDALKARKAAGEKISHLERQFYEGLEKVGGLKLSSYRSVEELPATSKRLAASTKAA